MVEFAQPAAFLCAAEFAFAQEFEPGLGDVRREDGVGRRNISGAHDAAEHNVLGLAGETDSPGAFQDEVAIGQHVGNQHRGAAGDDLGIVDLAAAAVVGLAAPTEAGQLTALCAEAADRRGKEKLRHRALGGVGGVRRLVRSRGQRGGFSDDDGDDITDAAGFRVGREGELARTGGEPQ